MLAEGVARITETDQNGRTALLLAADTSLPTLIWLLNEGGACITERDHVGNSTLLCAALSRRLPTCQWLLEHGGADIAEANFQGDTIWDLLISKWHLVYAYNNAAAVTDLLRVMVLRSVPPVELAALLRPEHARVAEEGAQLRAALPAYHAQRRAQFDSRCPLIPPLQAIVLGYAEPTTEELWATVTEQMG
jgi:hypothetical protein